MLPGLAWSNLFNESEIKLSSEGINWKNFMNECLMETEIFNKNENEKEKCSHVDPNFVMDARHRMIKQSTQINPMPQALINDEAFKLLRIEKHDKLMRRKEKKLVDEEIAKAKQILEDQQLFTKKRINETNNKKSKSLSNLEKFPKLWKRVKSHNEVFNENTWYCQSVQITLGSKISQNAAIFYDVEVSSNQDKCINEFLKPISTQKDNLIENESSFKNLFWKIKDENKIRKRFFKKEIVKVVQELHFKVKKEEKIRKNLGIENLVNQKRMEHAWHTWKAHTQKHKNKRREKTMYKNKIETFMKKIKEKEIDKEKPSVRNHNKEIRANLMGENRSRETGKKLNIKEKEERLDKLMNEVKTSQTEALQKLKEFKRKGPGNSEKSANVEFLKRTEERWTERLKRRKEIEEKKRKMEEEKEKAQREKEEEKSRQEVECKRKNLAELREKRRLEKEKEEERKKEKERLRINMRLADSHYEKYVLRSYGMRPWKTIMKIKNSENQLALKFFESRLTRNVFSKWATMAREELSLKVARARAFYEKALKRKCLFIWVLLLRERGKQEQVARDWNELRVTERAFKKWLNFTQNERIDYLSKKYTAELSYDRKLKKEYLTKLRNYREFKKLEQAKEYRKKKWREKVKEILPDYQPVEIAENF